MPILHSKSVGKMATLITGGAGFIGSNLAAALRAQGEPIIIIDNFNTYYDPALKRANAARFAADPDAVIVEGDIRDAKLVEGIFTAYPIRHVAHLAAMSGVRNSVQDASAYYAVNVTGTLNLLEAARKHGVTQFSMASTSSVYGATEQLPFREDDPADRPLAPYPASKRAAEIMAYSYHNMFGLNISCLRFFNVYGPAGRPDMMPMRVMEAITTGKPITMYNGGDISRDWTYIDDTVQGIIAALQHPLGYQIMNIGNGAPISLTAFVAIIEALSGKTAIRNTLPAPRSEPPITFCDNTRARELIGFVPKIPVQEGLARTWDWFMNQRGGRG